MSLFASSVYLSNSTSEDILYLIYYTLTINSIVNGIGQDLGPAIKLSAES